MMRRFHLHSPLVDVLDRRLMPSVLASPVPVPAAEHGPASSSHSTSKDPAGLDGSDENLAADPKRPARPRGRTRLDDGHSGHPFDSPPRAAGSASDLVASGAPSSEHAGMPGGPLHAATIQVPAVTLGDGFARWHAISHPSTPDAARMSGMNGGDTMPNHFAQAQGPPGKQLMLHPGGSLSRMPMDDRPELRIGESDSDHEEFGPGLMVDIDSRADLEFDLRGDDQHGGGHVQLGKRTIRVQGDSRTGRVGAAAVDETGAENLEGEEDPLPTGGPGNAYPAVPGPPFQLEIAEVLWGGLVASLAYHMIFNDAPVSVHRRIGFCLRHKAEGPRNTDKARSGRPHVRPGEPIALARRFARPRWLRIRARGDGSTRIRSA